jgi:hypothetical protein
MDMSLSVVSNETQIEKKFNSPNKLEEKYGFDLHSRNRRKDPLSNLPASIIPQP